MSPAPCGHCGGRAISYGAHLVNLRPTRPCDRCGCLVRKKGFWTVLAVAAVVGAGIGYYIFSGTAAPVGESWLGVAAAAGLLLVLADYLAWRWIPWDPAGEVVEEVEELEARAARMSESGTPEAVESREHT